MEFTFDFNWKDYLPKEHFRTDKSEVQSTSRVNFSGFIGSEDQNPQSLNNDLQNSDRQDFGEITFSEDKNGRLVGRAVITTIGVYPYIKEDGSVQWELRHPDDVYDPESLATLELLPLTNDHPTERVTQDNVKDLQVGQFGEFVLVDTMHGFITNKVVVADAEAISDVKGGKRALSMGYSTDVIPESGVWNGVPYDARQTKIRYNHGSIVNRGRAGDAAVMKFDSFDGIQTIKKDNPVPKTVVNTDEEVTMGDKDFRTVKLDGVEYEAEPAVITAYTKAVEKLDGIGDLQTKIDALTKQLATVEGERDALKKDNEDLKKDLQNSIKADQLDSLFTKRQRLDEAISLAGIEDVEKMDVTARMEAVVIKVDESAKELLEARRDSDGYEFYLEARFDAAVKQLKEDDTTLRQNLSQGSGELHSDSSDNNEIKTDEDIWKGLVGAHKKKGA